MNPVQGGGGRHHRQRQVTLAGLEKSVAGGQVLNGEQSIQIYASLQCEAAGVRQGLGGGVLELDVFCVTEGARKMPCGALRGRNSDAQLTSVKYCVTLLSFPGRLS